MSIKRSLFAAAVTFATVLCLGITTFASTQKGADSGDSVQSTSRSASVDALFRTYPHGSYYTMNGSACTTCHNDGHATDFHSLACNCRLYKYYDNDITRYSYQCDAFARYCYYAFYGEDFGFHSSPYSAPYQGVQLTTSNIESVLTNIGNSSYIRGATSTGSAHSIFLLGINTSNDTVTIYDANADGQCGVDNITLSYSQFISRMKYIWFYCTSDGDFVVNI